MGVLSPYLGMSDTGTGEEGFRAYFPQYVEIDDPVTGVLKDKLRQISIS